MDADEREIYYFLKAWKHDFISAREICRRAGGKKKFHNKPDWAKPILHNMTERGILETDSAGHYRIKPIPTDTRMKRWISPQIAAILKKNNKDLADLAMSENDIDQYYESL